MPRRLPRLAHLRFLRSRAFERDMRALWPLRSPAQARRHALQAQRVGADPTAAPTPAPILKKADGPRNILVVIWDDWRDTGDPAATPNLSRLQSESLTFSRAYAQFPHCGPSRFSLLTGRHPARSGVVTADMLPSDALQLQYVPRFFTDHGYRVGVSGKVFHQRTKFYPAEWFNATDLSEHPVMFKSFPYSVCGSAVQCTCLERNTTGKKACVDYINMVKTVGWIREWQDKQTPWLIFSGFVRPHSDYRFPEWAASQPVKAESMTPLSDGIPPIADLIQGKSRCEGGKTRLESCQQAYARAVFATDRYLGAIVEALHETGQYDDTLIVVTSDHGIHLGRDNIDGHWGKNTLFDASLHIPLVIKPRATPGLAFQPVDDLVELVDIFPTLLEHAGLESEYRKATGGLALDGASLARYWAGSRASALRTATVALTPVCGLNQKGQRQNLCVNWYYGVDEINGVGITVRTGTLRVTEWRALKVQGSQCITARTEDACGAQGGCVWRMWYYEIGRDSYPFFCLADPANPDNIDWSEAGLLASPEVYDNQQQRNLFGGIAVPFSVREVYLALHRL